MPSTTSEFEHARAILVCEGDSERNIIMLEEIGELPAV
jgi:hypothetical protein